MDLYITFKSLFKVMETNNNHVDNISRNKIVALIAVLAGLYAVGSYLPGFPVIGVPGSKIDLVRALDISYGIVLGPIYGPITTFLGAIVGKTLTGGGIGLYFTPLAPITAYVAANIKITNGWKRSASVLFIIILIWYVTPLGRRAYLAPILHVSGLVIVLLLGDLMYRYINSEDRKKLYIGVFLTGIPSTLAGSLAGNMIYANLFTVAPEVFIAILPVTTVERLVITIISTAIGVPLIIAFRLFYPDL
jgi:hypothetical protein